MSSTTVAEFATELKKPTDTLLEQLKAAGVAKSTASDTLSDADKHSLLNYLQTSHGTATGERKKITLVKKSTTEIKLAERDAQIARLTRQLGGEAPGDGGSNPASLITASTPSGMIPVYHKPPARKRRKKKPGARLS